MTTNLTPRQAAGVNALILMARQNIELAQQQAATGERMNEDQQAHAERWAHGEEVLDLISGSAPTLTGTVTAEDPAK